jgi:hypothetical protein
VGTQAAAVRGDLGGGGDDAKLVQLQCALGVALAEAQMAASEATLAELCRAIVSRPFSSWNRPMLTEIYLCHACSYHEIEDGNGRAGVPSHRHAWDVAG